MVRKLVLRPSLGDLMSGVKVNGTQGIGRPFSNLVVQVPHTAPEGESVIPSMDVIQKMSELDGQLELADQALREAQADIAAAEAAIEANKTEADAKFESLENEIGNIEVGGGQYTISTSDPTPEDGVGKPADAVWEVRVDGEAVRRFVWVGTEWLPYKAGADFVAADKIAAAVGVFIDSMIENLSVTGVAKLKEATVNELWAKMAVVERLQVLEGIITKDMVATGAITGDKLTVDTAFISKLVAQNGWFGNVVAKNMTSSTIIGGMVQGAVVTTGAPGVANRTYMDTNGFTVYGGGKDLVKVGHGIPTGIAVNDPGTNDMIPLGEHAFGTKTWFTTATLARPGSAWSWNGWTTWDTTTFRSRTRRAVVWVSAADNDTASTTSGNYQWHVIVRAVDGSGNNLGQYETFYLGVAGGVRMGRLNISTDSQVTIQFFIRARWWSNNPNPPAPRPDIGFVLMPI